MVKKLLSILFIILFISINTFAQTIAANASTDKSTYLVGDYIHFNIKVEYNKGTLVYPPAIQDSLKNVSIIKSEAPVTKENNGKITTTYGYILSGYDSVGVTIPPIPIIYKSAKDTTIQTASTNEVQFTIQTVKVNTQSGIKDVKAPIKIPLDWKLILLWILIGIVVIGLAYYLYLRYVKKKSQLQPVHKVIKLPPHVVALNSLQELEDKKLWQQGKIKEYHSEITEIIRRYFEERFNFPALELTTSEAMDLLNQRKDTEPIRNITYDFLSNADLVKFAKFTPVVSLNEEMLKQAYSIVNKTIQLVPGIEKEEVSDVQ
jgi:hypothetical protein